MNGRYRNGGRRRPPHLRLIKIPVTQPADETTPPPLPVGYSGEAVAQAVIGNIFRDAGHLADETMVYVRDEFAAHSLDLSSEQSARLRKSVFNMVVGAFRTRLLVGLSDEDDLPDETTEPRMGAAAHPVEGLPLAGDDLMRRFREALMSEDEHP